MTISMTEHTDTNKISRTRCANGNANDCNSLQPCLVPRILWPWKPTILTGTRYLLSHPRFCLFYLPTPRFILLLQLGEFSRTLLCRGWEEAPYTTNNTCNMVGVIPFPHPLIHVDELLACHVSPLSTIGFLDLSV